MTDPVKRTETMRECTRVMFERFGDVGIGSSDPQPAPMAASSYGDRFMSALFGCQIRYFKDQPPAALAKQVDPEEMLSLEIPDLENNEAVNKMLSDARRLRSVYGFAYGYINTGSPLNVAVSLYGEDFLIACADAPEAARHVLRVIGETIFRLDKEICAVVEPGAFPRTPRVSEYGNCPAIMFSPSMYREVILPVDKWYRSQVREFHLHHCGVFDGFTDIYRELSPTTIDIGGGSDYRLLREAFPDTPCSLLINTGDVEPLSPEEIDLFVGNMVEGAAPASLITRITCPELRAGVPDETVRALATVHERL